MSWQVWVFYLLLIDSIIANLLAWINPKWYVRNFRTLSRLFPLTKGWTTLYLVLVLYLGYLTLQ